MNNKTNTITNTNTNKGFIQCYTGDGKGKTTAALGLALRAAGHNKKIIVFQFMKGQINYGELESIKKLSPNVKIIQGGRKEFVSKENPEEIDIKLAKDCWDKAKEAIFSKNYDIVILDELNVALDFKLLPIDEIISTLKDKPENVEIIITGRYAPKEIIEISDLVTEMKEVKHYYNKGIPEREGFEF